MKCKKDGSEMKLIHKERKMPGPEDMHMESLTEGQLADYMAAEESGDFGDWAILEKTYKCPKCGNEIIVQET